MTERRPWTQQQDKALKYLRQVSKVSKWSEISRRLEFEFHLQGRNGKQCRERYTNHLDESIKFTEITQEEEQKIFKLHDILGNKWSQICKDFMGRTQNQIKNHFHSKLRKAIRKLNKQIKLHFKKSIKAYKLNIVYKIVEASDFRFFSNLCLEQELKFFNDLKNLLLEYAGGKISQKIEISNLNRKEQAFFIVSKLDKFQSHLKENKSLISANRKNKKSLDRKIYYNDKTNNSTQNSQIQEFDDEVVNQEKEDIFLCQQSLIWSETGLEQQEELNENNSTLRTQNMEQRASCMKEQVEKKNCEVLSNQMEISGEVTDLKSQLKSEKPGIQIPQFINSIIEQQEFPYNLIERKFSLRSFESLIEFEDNYLNDYEIDMMLKKFDNFSNIESSLFE